MGQDWWPGRRRERASQGTSQASSAARSCIGFAWMQAYRRIALVVPCSDVFAALFSPLTTGPRPSRPPRDVRHAAVRELRGPAEHQRPHQAPSARPGTHPNPPSALTHAPASSQSRLSHPLPPFPPFPPSRTSRPRTTTSTSTASTSSSSTTSASTTTRTTSTAGTAPSSPSAARSSARLPSRPSGPCPAAAPPTATRTSRSSPTTGTPRSCP